MSSWFRTLGLGLILTGLAAALLAVAPAAAQPDPVVSIEALPGEVLIGETFTVTVEFSNQGDQPGFGPYLALCVPAPGADGDALGEPCDGFFFKSASAVFTGQTVSLTPVGPPLLHSPAGNPVSCQGLTEGSTNPLCKPPIPLPPGFENCQLVFLPLPFGSFYPGQPPVTIEITLQVHSFADPGTPLPVKVIGGFQLGSSPTGTGCSEGSVTAATTVPNLFKVRKRYLGPEGETTTGPNFPRPYRIEVDVADGQTLDPLVVTEDLPDSLIYLGPYGPPVVSAPPPGTSNGQVVLDFGQVTGTVSDTDAVFEFQFYAGDKDANGAPVLDPATCKGTAVDDVRGEAGWEPKDPRDTPGQVTSDVTPEDHILELECLAVQKKVSPVGPHIPGDELVYTLDFQVSDYVQTKDVILTDILSDGLLFLTQPAPTLTFTDKNGAVLGTFTLGADAIVDDSARNPCGNGETVVRFDVSQALAALTAGDPTAHPLHQAGVLTGGEAGPVPPSVAAVGTITYYARIEDEFHCPVPSKDQSVDKHDPLTNRIDVAGEILELAGEPGATTALDDSGAVVRIAHGQVKKSIIARNGDPNDPLLQASPPLFAPGDTATFRLSYCFPSTDAEDFRLEDFLPSPVFDAKQVTGVTLGPNDQLGAFLGGVWPQPCLDDQGNDPAPPGFADASKNSVCFSFGSFDDPKNEHRCVEVLFTVPVTAEPFADGLLLTNTVHESEQSSFNEPFDQTRIDQLELGQPVVRVSKGAVSACCAPPGLFLCTEPVGTFVPPATGPVPFSGPFLSCGIRFMPPLTSASLAATPIQSDVLGGLRAGDRVLFAVVVENTGSSPHGAFDVRVQESLPPGLKFPPALQGGIALCVEDGAGLPLPYNLLPGGLFGGGIELVDPGPTQGALEPGAGNATGSNIAVLTYILEVDPSLDIGACAANRAAVATYAGTEGGASHVAAGLGGPHQQSAQVCRQPGLVKSVVATSEKHTMAKNGAEELTIGELVRFRLVLEVPQGVLSDLRIEDSLPPGFIIPSVSGALQPEARIAFVSSLASGLTAGSLAAGPGLHVAGNETAVAGVKPSFDVPSANLAQSSSTVLRVRLGDLTNAEDDCDGELVVIEFNALVGNDAVNQSGYAPTNTARGLWDDQSIGSNPVKLRIVEPRLQIDKDMPEGRFVRLQITNEGTADAFDVVVTDELPESLCLQAGASVVVQPSAGATVTVVDRKVEVKIDHIPVGGQVVIGFEAFLCGEPICEGTLNVADVTWTSLPGPQRHPDQSHRLRHARRLRYGTRRAQRRGRSGQHLPRPGRARRIRRLSAGPRGQQGVHPHIVPSSRLHDRRHQSRSGTRRQRHTERRAAPRRRGGFHGRSGVVLYGIADPLLRLQPAAGSGREDGGARHRPHPAGKQPGMAARRAELRPGDHPGRRQSSERPRLRRRLP